MAPYHCLTVLPHLHLEIPPPPLVRPRSVEQRSHVLGPANRLSVHIAADVRQLVHVGLYKTNGAESADGAQNRIRPIGFARLVTDYVTLAYLTDVYIAEEHRGLGLGQWVD